MTVRTTIPVARPLLPALEALAPYLTRIDASRWYSNFGPLCVEFEARLAERFGLTADCVTTVANATVGLTLALQTSGARPGSLCVVPSWTFPASVQAAIQAGLRPLFVDVDEDGLLTPAIARDALTAAPGPVGAMMPVAVYGQPLDSADWDAFAAETGVPVVIDAAPGYDSVKASATLSVVSLHATKILGVGEGGFVMSTDPGLVREVRQRSNFGFYGSREAEMAATNGKLSEYAAAVGLAGMDQWPQRRSAFQAVANRYRANLEAVPGLGLPKGYGEFWLAATCILEADFDVEPLAVALRDAGIDTRAWWGRGMHLQAAFRECPRLPLPVTERLSRTTLGVPCFTDMALAQVDHVCAVLAGCVAAT